MSHLKLTHYQIQASLKRKSLWVGVVCLVACTCIASKVFTAQETLAARESRGKQIYVHGTSPSGKPILAYLGEDSLEVPGSTMPCANCHGLDGQGKPEGGVAPSNV